MWDFLTGVLAIVLTLVQAHTPVMYVTLTLVLLFSRAGCLPAHLPPLPSATCQFSPHPDSGPWPNHDSCLRSPFRDNPQDLLSGPLGSPFYSVAGGSPWTSGGLATPEGNLHQSPYAWFSAISLV